MDNSTTAHMESRYRTRRPAKALRDRQRQRNADHHDRATERHDSLADSTGNIPAGDIRVQFADDSYNPDKHFNAAGVAPNSSGLYTGHWDNIQIYTANQRERVRSRRAPASAFTANQ